MKPVILVLCEGETEECYIDFLKQKYRLPIKIVSKIVGSKINERLIKRYKKDSARAAIFGANFRRSDKMSVKIA